MSSSPQPEGATVDELTGLPNPRQFERVLLEQVERSASTGKPLSLLVFDIDHFKALNDAHGDRTGDEILVKVAELLRGSVKSGDLVARLARDEFAMILEDVDNLTALRIATRVAEGVAAQAVEAQGMSFALTVSAGVATCPEDGGDVRSLLAFANRALLAEKRRGGNGVCGRRELLMDNQS